MHTIPTLALQPHRGETIYPGQLQVIAWSDPVVERVGFPPHHAYVELLWLPIVGPSATWLYRRLGDLVTRRPAGTIIDVGELAASIGLSEATTPHSPAQRSLRRLDRFGLARWDGRYAVRTLAPPLAQRHLERLPPALRAAHHALIASRTEPAA